MAHYGCIRDEIRAFVKQMPESLPKTDEQAPNNHERQFEMRIKRFLSLARSLERKVSRHATLWLTVRSQELKS